MTKQEAWRLGTELLQQSGVDDSRWQAELLLRSALREDRARFFASLAEEVCEQAEQIYLLWLADRQRGMPLQYLTGRQEFMGLEVTVTPDVLIPRPDTEILVEETVQVLGGLPAVRVAELATGSGAIALALAAQLPEAMVVATDISPGALQVASANAVSLGLAERIDWRLGSWAEPLANQGTWHAIVSNPPYIPSGKIQGLSREVQHEPRLALDGGPDGLDCYRQLIPQAAPLLRPGGHLLLEVGAGQDAAVAELMRAAGLGDVYTVPDLAGIQRVVVGSRGDVPR